MPPNTKQKFPTGLIAATLLIIAAAVYFLFFYNKGKSTGSTDMLTDTITIDQPADSIAPKKYELPKELLFTGKKEKTDYPGPLFPRFFPIGWSADGKFAYINEPVDEACGCYFFEFFIIDLVKKDTTWQWKKEMQEEDGYDFNKGNDFHLNKVWTANVDLFSGKLKEAGIQQTAFAGLSALPVNDHQRQFAPITKNTMIDSEDFGMKMLAKSDLIMIEDGKSTSTIYTEKYTQDSGESKNFTTAISNKIYGYLKHPTADQYAIFYSVEYRGWEGPPNVITYSLVGFKPAPLPETDK